MTSFLSLDPTDSRAKATAGEWERVQNTLKMLGEGVPVYHYGERDDCDGTGGKWAVKVTRDLGDGVVLTQEYAT